MQYRWLCVCALVSVSATGIAVRADESPPPPTSSEKTITIPTQVQPKEVREYKVDFDVKQKRTAGGASATGLDAAIFYKIRHSYSRREDDGMLPMEVSLVEGHITAQGQTFQITPSLYPKLTVLLDRDFAISEIFGAAGSRLAQGLPGVNYGNLIMFFYAVGGQQPHKVGESWKTQIKIPSLKETYDVTNTLKGLETVDGQEAARIAQDYVRTPASNTKLSAESLFSIKDGRLVKSRIDCEVDVPADATAAEKGPMVRAVVKVEITTVK